MYPSRVLRVFFYVEFIHYHPLNVPMSLLSCLELESPDRTCSLDKKTHFDRQFHVPNAFCMPLFDDSYARKCSFLQVFGWWRPERPDVVAELVRFVPFHSFMIFILFWEGLTIRKGFTNVAFYHRTLNLVISALNSLYCRQVMTDSREKCRKSLVRELLSTPEGASRYD